MQPHLEIGRQSVKDLREATQIYRPDVGGICLSEGAGHKVTVGLAYDGMAELASSPALWDKCRRETVLVHNATVDIGFTELWTHANGEVGSRASVRNLGVGEHIHGDLRIVVAGRTLPSMGYFGPDDVCFNEWVRELADVRRLIDHGDDFVHVYDEGEQGQPVYEFRRQGDRIFVSVLESLIGGGQADEAWQRTPIPTGDLRRAIDDLLGELSAAVLRESPSVGPLWLNALIGR